MKYFELAGTDLRASSIIMGNMRMNTLSTVEVERLTSTAFEMGINVFDHADIYGDGECERLFSQATTMQRDEIILQSKCGIRKGKGGFFDFSKEHIVRAVDGILSRLNTDYLDILLLHRPDPLVEPEQVGAAFDALEQSGRCRYFGVSNHNPMQIELLQKHLSQKLVINQLQLSITHTPMIDSGMTLNMHNDQAVNRDSSILDYCRLHDITVQAWSPLQTGFFDGVFVGDKRFPELNKVLNRLAEKYSTSPSTIAYAWIVRHPANIQVVTGTRQIDRLQEAVNATNIHLTRSEWFQCYRAAGNIVP
ncbi:LOW QUALITY PROTEIN: oxidoreductase [Geomicrobium sp. JCM 19037]|nr:LOW QUALITY PROTEIN: oxidoreductase [Geomicrobium sp. JCM 19037]